MAKLSDYYKNIPSQPASFSQLFSPVTNMFAPVTRTLPNGGGSYQAPGSTPSLNAIATGGPQSFNTTITPAGTPTPTNTPVVKAPVKSPVFTPTPTQDTGTLDYSKYTDPVTGKVLTPQEYADMMARKVQGGSVPDYAGNALTNPNQTVEQLSATGRNLNNARNDIATGATDPYHIASQSGIQYTPTELKAVEKAYAGIYDPAINDVFSKLDKKEKEAANALQMKNELEKLRVQHQYAMEEKALTSGNGLSGGGGGGVYVEGQNPIVDGWVQRLNQSGQDINDAIPGVKNQALRNAVMLGLNANKSKNAKYAGTLDDINTISTMLQNPSLSHISGFSDQLLGGMFGQAKVAKTQYNQILGTIQLAKAGQIKGQGQISDYERKVLKEASGAIDRGMSDDDFRKALVKLRGVLQTSSGLPAKVKVIDPATGESDIQNLDTNEINGFIQDGAIIEYTE